MGTNGPPGLAASIAFGPPPQRLGRYEVLRRMAVGGMAEIYLAKSRGPEGFEKHVVVKRILPRLATSAEVVTMFLDEARIAATLRHSNIVQVYDIGEEDGEFFFAMELLHGEDAGALMQALAQRERPLPLELAVGIVCNVCAGLHYAHERRGPDGAPLDIVHRDVSPSNIFVTMDGEVKLLDFGVAKAAHRLSVTSGGIPKGKLTYMSPEQVQGRPLDRRSDIFSLAVVLWELTANRRLLRGKSDFETMQAITDQDAPPPSVFCDDYPPDLERIVVRGLARTPEARYQTAQELQLALEEFAREHKLAVSAISLAALMKDLFGERRTAWLEAVVPETAPSLPVAAPPPTSTAAAAPPGAPAPAPPAALTAPRPPAFVEHAPTLEIPVLTAHQLATMPAGPLSQEPGASRAGELQAPPRRRTADLPLVVASATVAADAIASATAATDPQLPRTTLPHAAAPGRGGHLALVLVLLAGAVVCLLGGGFLLWRLGVFDAAPPAGRATPAARPAPRPHSPRATPARSAPRAPAPKTHSNRGSPHDTKGR